MMLPRTAASMAVCWLSTQSPKRTNSTAVGISVVVVVAVMVVVLVVLVPVVAATKQIFQPERGPLPSVVHVIVELDNTVPSGGPYATEGPAY